jgi:hypothetical protein
MTWIAHILHHAVGLLLAPFDFMGPLLGLTLLSGLTGVAMLWVYGKTTPQGKIKKAKDSMIAAVYEVRLYLDSPKRVLSATGRMLAWTTVHLALMLPAFIVIGPPMGLVLLHMDMRYGKAPLPINEQVLVKIKVRNKDNAQKVSVKTSPKSPIRITAPMLFIEREKTLYVRTKIKKPGTHSLNITINGDITKKRLTATQNPRKLSISRSSGFSSLWAQTTEPPLKPGGVIQSIRVDHPDNNRTWAGIPVPWWGYWLLVSFLVAWLLSRRLGVEL